MRLSSVSSLIIEKSWRNRINNNISPLLITMRCAKHSFTIHPKNFCFQDFIHFFCTSSLFFSLWNGTRYPLFTRKIRLWIWQENCNIFFPLSDSALYISMLWRPFLFFFNSCNNFSNANEPLNILWSRNNEYFCLLQEYYLRLCVSVWLYNRVECEWFYDDDGNEPRIIHTSYKLMYGWVKNGVHMHCTQEKGVKSLF